MFVPFPIHLQQSGMEGSAWKYDPINYNAALFPLRMTGQWQSNSLTLTRPSLIIKDLAWPAKLKHEIRIGGAIGRTTCAADGLLSQILVVNVYAMCLR